MFNSIIIAHRDRPKCIKVLLRSLLVASQKATAPYEIIIADLNSKKSSQSIFDEYEASNLNLRVLRHRYSGPFWKTKALNSAAKKAKGKYLTMIDADSVVNCCFFSSIEDFFSCQDNANTKLAHRVFYVSPITSQFLYKRSNNFDCNFLSNNIWKIGNTYSRARERFTGQEKFLDQIHKSKQQMALDKWALGNSHFTMKRKFYMEIGGCDERFIGHGLEDLDFNLRLWKHIHSGTLRTQLQYSIYHLSHKKESDWFNDSMRIQNRKIYRENKRRKISAIPIKNDWGIF